GSSYPFEHQEPPAYRKKSFLISTLLMSNTFTTRMATMDTRSFVILAIAVCCAVLPLEITHLLSACVGAGLYLLVQALQGASVAPKRGGDSKSGKGGKGAGKAWGQSPPTSREWAPRGSERAPRLRDSAGLGRGAPLESASRGGTLKPEVRKPSAVPVLAPTFQSTGWEAEAEVAGFASGSLVSGKAFGVAVPEVDIVVNANPQVAGAGRMSWTGGWCCGPGSRSPT
ncbi:unnamed protein product, partial [Prorocentrum cordatum]